MPRLNTRQQFERMPDRATPAERKWLDLYAKWVGFGGPGRYKITGRSGPATGQFRFVTILCYHGGNGHFIGCMALNLPTMKRLVRKYQAQERRRRARQAILETGAYI